MIIRGGGAIGAAGLAGGATCICAALFCAKVCVAAGGAPTGTAGVAARGGVVIPSGAVLGSDEAAAGVDTLGAVTETFGGITTTDGGR